MKAKSLGTLVASVLGVGAVVLTGALIIGNGDLSSLGIARANPTSQGSYVISASDFSDGAGNINVGGDTWHFEKASKSGDVVSIGGVFYTSTRSGASKADGRRGDGYTRLVFSGLDQSHAVGLVLYEKGLDEPVKNTITTITSDMDLTVGSTIASANRRGLQFAQAEGEGKYFSFSTMTVYYGCADVTPIVDIENTEVQIGVSENANLTTTNSDVFDGDTVSYAWESDDTDVATVVGNGANAVVTGVTAGSANVTVTMTVNGTNYSDSIEVTVTQVQATVKEMTVLSTSKIEGAGIFCRFNPSSADTTSSKLDELASTKEVSLVFEANGITTKVNSITLQEKSDSSYTAYLVCDKADGLNGAFTATITFKDNANNIHYKAACYFDKGALSTPIKLDFATNSLIVGTPGSLTANKYSTLEGEATFAFVSSNTNVLTVSANDNVATLNGVAAGEATVTVTMTVGGKQYTKQQAFEVASGVTEVPLTITGATWGGAGCQFSNDMSFASAEGTFQIGDYGVTVTVTGASFSYSGVGACLQGSAIYLTFTAAPGANDKYTVHCELTRSNKAYTFTVSFVGTEMQ